MSEKTSYKLKKKCKCSKQKQQAVVINHSLAWGDGDVVCNNCKCYIRSYNSG